MENRVTHFEIQADVIERAKAFYEEVFGWKVEKWMSADKDEGMDYWGLITGKDTPGINGGLYPRPPERKLYTYDCTISVEDLDRTIAMIKKNGGTIRKDKMEIKGVGWFAACVDTEGNMFGIIQSTMDPIKKTDSEDKMKKM